MSAARATYSYADLTLRIEQVLGERPSRSALRAAAAEQRRRTVTGIRPRATAGMPTPLPSPSRTAPAKFDADQVEAWLAHHPRLVWAHDVDELAAALTRGVPEADAVSAALGCGLSWRIITSQLNAHDGRGRSVAGIHKRYRRSADHGHD